MAMQWAQVPVLGHAWLQRLYIFQKKATSVQVCIWLLLLGVMFQTFKLMSAPAGLAQGGRGAAIPLGHCKFSLLLAQEWKIMIPGKQVSLSGPPYSIGGWAGLRHTCGSQYPLVTCKHCIDRAKVQRAVLYSGNITIWRHLKPNLLRLGEVTSD